MADQSISVLTTSFERLEKLSRNIDAVASLSWIDNHIIHDDASTSFVLEDEFRNWGRHNVTLKRHKQNVGLGKNFESLIDAVTSDWFVVCSDDDYLFDIDRDEMQSILSRFSDACFVVFQVEIRNVRSGHTGVANSYSFPALQPIKRDEALDAFIKHGFPVWTGVLFNTNVVKAREVRLASSGTGVDRQTVLNALENGTYIVFVNKVIASFEIDAKLEEGGGKPHRFAWVDPGFEMFSRQISRLTWVDQFTARNLRDIFYNRYLGSLQGLFFRYLSINDLESAALVSKKINENCLFSVPFRYFSEKLIVGSRVKLIRKVLRVAYNLKLRISDKW